MYTLVLTILTLRQKKTGFSESFETFCQLKAIFSVFYSSCSNCLKIHNDKSIDVCVLCGGMWVCVYVCIQCSLDLRVRIDI